MHSPRPPKNPKDVERRCGGFLRATGLQTEQKHFRFMFLTDHPWGCPTGYAGAYMFRHICAPGHWFIMTSCLKTELEGWEHYKHVKHLCYYPHAVIRKQTYLQKRFGNDPWTWVKHYSDKDPRNWHTRPKYHDLGSRVVDMYKQGYTIKEISLELNLIRQTVYGHVNKYKKNLTTAQ
tara:strand:- start:29 stop:559 length:531 start_codon:yes stop_codon:yes gene_type:complete